MSELTISRNDISIAGEFYIAYILAKHGFKVSPTLGRTEVFDLFVQNPQGKNLTISVKTTLLEVARFVLVGKKSETAIDECLFYAIVRLNMPDGVPEFWIVPSTIMMPLIKESYKIYLETPKRDGIPHKDTPIREFHLTQRDNFPDDWEEQLKGFKGNIDLLK